MLLLLALFLGVALGALPHGLTAAQIGNAKKQCQSNCAHISAHGRSIVQRNRCIQQCWNDFFQSVTEAKQKPVTAVAAPTPAHHKPVHPQRTGTKAHVAPFRNMAHPNKAVTNALRGRTVRTAGAQLKSMGAVALGVLIMVAVGLML
jgi:hypothetical protein